MKRFAVLALLVTVTLAGCVSTRPGMSYVAPDITAADAALLAADAVEHLRVSLPPAHTTVVLEPPTTHDVVTPVLVERLRAAGYGLVLVEPQGGRAEEAKTANGVKVRYLVSPMQHGVLLRLQYKDVEAARFYPRGSDGNLVQSVPFMVRIAGQGVSQ